MIKQRHLVGLGQRVPGMTLKPDCLKLEAAPCNLVLSRPSLVRRGLHVFSLISQLFSSKAPTISAKRICPMDKWGNLTTCCRPFDDDSRSGEFSQSAARVASLPALCCGRVGGRGRLTSNGALSRKGTLNGCLIPNFRLCRIVDERRAAKRRPVDRRPVGLYER